MRKFHKLISGILIIAIFVSIISLESCSSTPPRTYTVNYYTGDHIFYSCTIQEGALVENIDGPDTETQYFRYWKKSDGTEYDFGFWTSTGITSDLNLYAHYEFDATLATNSIKNSHLSPHLKIQNNTKFKDKFLWFEFDASADAHGSGVIYDYKDDYYYVLTNAHVIVASEKIANQAISYDFFNISVIDYQDEMINAEVAFYRVDYDLAILRFKSQKKYEIIKFADKSPDIGDHCIAVGNPLSSRNKITVGNGESYEKITLSNSELTSNVTFDVYKHSANVKPGSSGGALLNENLELIGINYAGKFIFTIITLDSFALPISEVKEFISLYIVD